MCWYTEEMTMLLTEGAAMSKRVMAAVLAVLVAGRDYGVLSNL
jgi:hypothetical protein